MGVESEAEMVSQLTRKRAKLLADALPTDIAAQIVWLQSEQTARETSVGSAGAETG